MIYDNYHVNKVIVTCCEWGKGCAKSQEFLPPREKSHYSLFKMESFLWYLNFNNLTNLKYTYLR